MSIPLDPLGRISALCSPMTSHRLCLSPFFLFFRRKKGTPRGRRKKAPLFRTKKPPSLLQLRTRRWKCQGRVATRRRWQRRQKVRQVGAVTGNVLSSAGSAAWSWQRPLCTASSRAANVSTHRGLSPQSHTEVTLSHSTRGILDASGFHACKECPGSVPSSRVCMDGWMAILGALWFLISISALSKSTQLPRAFCKSHFLVFCSNGGSLHALSHHCGLSWSLSWAQGEITHQGLCVPVPIPSSHCCFPGQWSSQSPALEQRQGKPWSPTSKADSPCWGFSSSFPF